MIEVYYLIIFKNNSVALYSISNNKDRNAVQNYQLLGSKI